MASSLAETREVREHFPVKRSLVEGLLSREKRYVRAVDGVSISIEKGQVFVLVGESGSGKTTLGKVMLGIYRPTAGSVLFDGRDVSKLYGRDYQDFRRAAQMIYQDPVAALNPRVRVGKAIKEPLEFNRVGTESEQEKVAMAMMKRVGLDPPEEFYRRYPHELSGGQKQRVVIARALVLNPRFVVADEPVAMLDVSVRAQILKLILDLKLEMDLTLLIITHDLAIAKYFADQVAIMYLGKVVESAPRDEIFRNPLHPYTKVLFSSIPIPEPGQKRDRIIIQGDIPSAIDPPPACRFHTRCPYVFDRCKVELPELVERSPGHFVACHLYDK